MPLKIEIANFEKQSLVFQNKQLNAANYISNIKLTFFDYVSHK